MEKTAGTASSVDREFDFLRVDDFMRHMLDARALATAFETGLVDMLCRDGESTMQTLLEQLGLDSRGGAFLLDLLAASGVIREHQGVLSLTDRFVDALRFRDLMELKLALSNFAAHDFLDYFSDLVTSPGQFMSKARFHRLFAYDRCSGSTEEDLAMTKRWMHITTVLTRYEALACLKYYDFSRNRNVLDVGGNSGEFALRLCRACPHLRATVLDLPLVCDVGREHLAGEPEEARIAFMKGNALADDFPSGHDLVTFKSMLHDWPDHVARDLMRKAADSLEPGGAMVIFERAAPVSNAGVSPYSVLPFLIFFHSYRAPAFYSSVLEDLGFLKIQSRIINLEMPFLLVTGLRGSRD